MDTRRKKDILIVAMVFSLCVMAVAYAMLSGKVDEQGTTNGLWLVEITGVEEATATQGQVSDVTVSSNVTTANFGANLYQPGDSVTYTVTVENKGTLDARLDNITSNLTANPNVGTDDNPYIIYTYEGIASGSVLAAGDSITFTVTIQYNPEAPTITVINANLETVLNYKDVQNA